MFQSTLFRNGQIVDKVDTLSITKRLVVCLMTFSNPAAKTYWMCPQFHLPVVYKYQAILGHLRLLCHVLLLFDRVVLPKSSKKLSVLALLLYAFLRIILIYHV